MRMYGTLQRERFNAGKTTKPWGVGVLPRGPRAPLGALTGHWSCRV